MEAVMGEVDEISKEENPSLDCERDAVRINGEINGIGGMEVCSVHTSEKLIGSKNCNISDECVDECGSLLSSPEKEIISSDIKSCMENTNVEVAGDDCFQEHSELGHEVPADSEVEEDIAQRAVSETSDVGRNSLDSKGHTSNSTVDIQFESMDCDSVSSTAKDEYCSDVNSDCENSGSCDIDLKVSEQGNRNSANLNLAAEIIDRNNTTDDCTIMEAEENEDMETYKASSDVEADGTAFEESGSLCEKSENSCGSVELTNEQSRSVKIDQAVSEVSVSQDCSSSVISDADTDCGILEQNEDPISVDKGDGVEREQSSSEPFQQFGAGVSKVDISDVKNTCSADDNGNASNDSLDKKIDSKIAGDSLRNRDSDNSFEKNSDSSFEKNSDNSFEKNSNNSFEKSGDNIVGEENDLQTSVGNTISLDETENENSITEYDTAVGQTENDSGQSLDKTNDTEELDGKTDGDTPGKMKKNRKNIVSNLTPRRSSRNLNKQKSYIEKEEDPDIQEIAPVDPLAVTDPLRDDKENSKYRSSKKTTIVVNDTKRLAEIAAGTKHIKGKKEPTLVIIDTNSILAGKGPVPISQEPSPLAGPSSTSSYSVLPLAVPAQGMYPRMSNPLIPAPAAKPTPPPPPTPPAPVLPTLTDDMFVVEAPSFIVPYVYEKPPIKPLKRFVEQLKKQLDEKSKDREQKLKSGPQDQKLEVGIEKQTGDSMQNGEMLHSNSNLENGTKENCKEQSDKLEVGGENKEPTDKEHTDSSKACGNGDPVDTNSSIEAEKKEIKKDDDEKERPLSYFEEPTGKFFMQIGFSLVQEYVQTDLLRSQKRKREREGGKPNSVTQHAINSLLKNLEFSKENNEPFHMELKKCEYCNFKTESSLVMAQHLETPHMRNYVYRCNFCPLEVRSPHDILFHMETEHNVRGRLERAPAFHQCPNCPFEDNQKGKLSRHLMSCTKKHKPERNQEPPLDWEPPAKIPKVSRSRTAPPLGLGAAAYQAMQGKTYSQHPLLPKLVPGTPLSPPVSGLTRGRGRPPLHSRYYQPQDLRPTPAPPPQPRQVAPAQLRQGMLFRQAVPPSQSQVLLPTAYQLSGSQLYQGTKYLLASSPLMVGNPSQMMPMMPGMPPVPRLTIMPPSSASAAAVPTPVALVPNISGANNSITIQSANSKNPAAKLLQQPSISITPLPRQAAGVSHTPNSKHPGLPGHPGTPGSKPTFVICEICDGYIKDLEQLRNHMQWIHKVKIHPKMIYNRPPLNCQKCQFRFFTDQGLERHLLGSHGLVTSSMQENSNKGKDSGRCPICGRVYQWKLLNHVSRDHNMSLKPAHLSYKCTVCTATFGMYKQFENHVYSAHSVVAKSRVIDKKPAPPPPPPRLQAGDTILKPLKINDEITIIPQPARPRPGPASRTGAISALMQQKQERVYYCESCEATFDGSSGFAMYLGHVKRRHLHSCSVKLCRLEECPTCSRKVSQDVLSYIEDNKNGVDVIELSDDELLIAGQGRNEITITKVPCAPGPKRFKHKLQRRSNVQVIELEDSPVKNKNSDENTFRENGEDSLSAVKERLRRRKSLEISQVDSECSSPISGDDLPTKRRRIEDE